MIGIKGAMLPEDNAINAVYSAMPPGAPDLMVSESSNPPDEQFFSFLLCQIREMATRYKWSDTDLHERMRRLADLLGWKTRHLGPMALYYAGKTGCAPGTVPINKEDPDLTSLLAALPKEWSFSAASGPLETNETFAVSIRCGDTDDFLKMVAMQIRIQSASSNWSEDFLEALWPLLGHTLLESRAW